MVDGENMASPIWFHLHYPIMIPVLSGWWYTYPSEKYKSQLGLLFPIYGKIQHVPNHQPSY